MKSIWATFGKKAIFVAVAIMALSVAFFVSACGNTDGDDGSDPAQSTQIEYKITFETDGGTVPKAISAKAGESITPPEDPIKSGYVFEGWYTSQDYSGSSVQIPDVMPSYDVTYYARFVALRKVRYSINLDGVPYEANIESDQSKEGSEVIVKDGTAFGVKGFMFVGWTTEKTGTFTFGNDSEGQYEPGDRITLGKSDVDLYAQWALEVTYAGGETDDRIYIYAPLIGKGKGAAIRVCAGKENKLGFVSQYPQSEIYEFTFMYDDIDGGDVIGRISPDGTYILKDKAAGMYLMYDYVTQDAYEYVLTTDGYGFATVTRMVGNQTSTLAYGKYEYDEQYDDYRFVSLDPATGAADGLYNFYFMLRRGTVDGTEFDGYFSQQGYESGSYLMYYNGELYNYRLDINGYGDARLYSYNVLTEQTELESYGTYHGTDKYEDEYGEWEYLPSDGYGFRFLLNVLSDTDGDISVYICYDSEINVTLNEDGGDSTLYLDGYGSAQYSSGSEEFVGYCVISESKSLITFVPIVSDGAGGKMYFNVNWSTKKFTVNTTGFVIDGTVLTSYEGEGRVVVIPGEITEISDNAFNYVRTEVNLVSVTIPAGVTKIGKLAFQNPYSLERATFLSEDPIEIDWSAENNPFRWPAGSFVIVVPEGSQEAYKSAWSNCPYTIKGSVEVTLLDEFEVQNGVLVRYNKQPDAPETLDIVIPDEVTEIAKEVFRGLDYVRSVDLNNVTKVGEGAFENCVNLRKVVFGAVQHVGNSAFAGCWLLASGAEYGDGTVELPQIITVGANAFRGCENLRLVRLGENLTNIGDTAFSECHVYEKDSPLCLELIGTTPPEMGASVGLGNISMRIIVSDAEVAKKCFVADSWNSYCRHLYIESGDEKGKYMDGSDTLELDGRAVFMTVEVMLYEISGSEITFYAYDADTAQYSVIKGSFVSGKITVKLGSRNYEFVRVDGDVTYTSSDKKYSFTCNPSALDPTTYEDTGYKGTATVLFNGSEVQLNISGFNSKVIVGFVDTDGKMYDFKIISVEGNTFTYEKVRNEYIRDITSEDGSVLNVHFSGNIIYIFGELRIIVDEAENTVLPAWSDNVTIAQSSGNGVYEFDRQYKNTKYHIRIVLSANSNTFTYTYTII